MKNKKLVTILSILLVIVIGTAVVSVMLLNSNSKTEKYRKKLDMANKYVAEENWDDAIVAYLDAIEIDDTDENAYYSLATIYIYQNRMGEAKELLEKGMDITKSSKLQELYDKYFKETSSKVVEEGAKEHDQSVSLNTSLLKEISNYSFNDYSSKYGFSSSSMNGKECNISYKDLKGATFIYYNDGDLTKLVDENTATPADSAMPWEVEFVDTSLILSNIGEGVNYSKLESTGIKNVKFNSNAKTITFTSSNCDVSIACDKDGNISLNSKVTVTPKSSNEDIEETQSVKGMIVSATTGKGINGATLVIRDKGVTSGSSLAEVKTGSDGSYTVDLEPGEYTAEVECEGYITENINFEVDKWGDISVTQFVISEEMAAGEIRIVLEWGEYPRDLDSHLTDESGNEIAFYNKNQSFGNLDVDNTSSYGPETITITNINGKYHYFVHDFTESGNFGSSGAVVKVYLPGKSAPEVFQIPTDIQGDKWDVFDIENGELKPVG